MNFVIESFVFNICVLCLAHASQVAAKGASSSATTATACLVRKSATEYPTAPEAKTNSIAVSLSLLSLCYLTDSILNCQSYVVHF